MALFAAVVQVMSMFWNRKKRPSVDELIWFIDRMDQILYDRVNYFSEKIKILEDRIEKIEAEQAKILGSDPIPENISPIKKDQE